MTNPLARIVNATTNETIERELTSEEIQEIQEAQAAREQQLAEQESLAAAKQAAQDKLKALGLTDLEIAAITGA